MADIPISKMVVPGSNDTLVLKDGSAANKVQSATSGNLASLDSTGNLADSGIASAIFPSGASTSNKLATASDIPVITGKADKVSGATTGNLASLDASGNLTDSGIAAGNTSISSIGDGTVSGAISALANTVVGSFSYDASTGHIYFTPYSGSPYTFTLQNGHMMVNT